ncbi:MAG: hypothetical protein R6V50_01665 [Thermoplasmatota archaeon]
MVQTTAMNQIYIEIGCGIGFIILFFYFTICFYPLMRQEWKKNKRDWRYYYHICGDDNRKSYLYYLRFIHSLLK